MKSFKFENTNIKRGFTLIELLVALSIFIIIMTISMGSIVNIFEANRKARSTRTVMSNLNLALDSMSREMRYGSNYDCGSIGGLLNCPSGDNTQMTFTSNNNETITYQLSSGKIMKRVNSGGWVDVTAPELIIDDFDFYTTGAGTSNTLQPKVVIKLKAHTGTGKNRSDITMQTLVSQRILDI